MRFLSKLIFLPRPGYPVLRITPATATRECDYCDSTKNTNQSPALVTLPEKPKKPSSSFMLFMQSIRQDILSKKPDTNQRDVVKIAANIWKSYSGDQKAPFVATYSKAFAKYVDALHDYKSSLTIDHVKLIQHENAVAAKKKLSRKMTRLNRPKRPTTKYAIFLKSRKDELKNYPNPTDFFRAVAIQYRQLTSEEQQKYEAESAESKKKYKADLAEWEDSILKSTDKGHKCIQKAILDSRERKQAKKQVVVAKKSVEKQTGAGNKRIKKVGKPKDSDATSSGSDAAEG